MARCCAAKGKACLRDILLSAAGQGCLLLVISRYVVASQDHWSNDCSRLRIPSRLSGKLLRTSSNPAALLLLSAQPPPTPVNSNGWLISAPLRAAPCSSARCRARYRTVAGGLSARPSSAPAAASRRCTTTRRGRASSAAPRAPPSTCIPSSPPPPPPPPTTGHRWDRHMSAAITFTSAALRTPHPATSTTHSGPG